MKISEHLDSSFTDGQAWAIVGLIDSVWPRTDKTHAEMVEDLLASSSDIATADSEETDDIRIVIWEENQAIAHAHSFCREVSTAEGSLKLMALAGVCVSPRRRGQGFGARVVRRAFQRVDNGIFPVSLFQTEVPDFYKKTGARIVDNEFVNSKSEEDQQASPWWDPNVMIYPGDFAWPSGPIDLNGAGY